MAINGNAEDLMIWSKTTMRISGPRIEGRGVLSTELVGVLLNNFSSFGESFMRWVTRSRTWFRFIVRVGASIFSSYWHQAESLRNEIRNKWIKEIEKETKNLKRKMLPNGDDDDDIKESQIRFD